MPFLSWVDFSIKNGSEKIGRFSLSLEKKDFLFLAGETNCQLLIRSLAGFEPNASNSAESARIKGIPLKGGENFRTVLLPKNAAENLPKSRKIGDFALDISSNRTRKSLAEYAKESGIDVDFLNCKPNEIDLPDLQKISLWLTSLYKTDAVFIEEPEYGFCEEARPFDFLQNMLLNNLTSVVVYFTPKMEGLMQRVEALQFCNAKIAVFCADKLVEMGKAVEVLKNPLHSYTKDYLKNGSTGSVKKNGALWAYCSSNCNERQNCPKWIAGSPAMWECGENYEHKVICKFSG